MNILVTGGAGYIGSHTCVELLNAGYQGTVVGNLSISKEESLHRVQELAGKKLSFHKVDIRDREGLTSILKTYPVHAVIHFAGFKAVGESVTIPLSYYDNNITGTLVLLEVMKEAAVKNIVFSSSSTVYGYSNNVPFKEYYPLGAINPYGRTKLMIEEIMRDLHAAEPEWNIALLRYFNPVGAHPSGRIGEDPNGIPNNLMPYVAQVAVGRHPYVRVWGNDYPTLDGTGVRDYIHVMDLATGHIKALERLDENPGLVTYNLGTGRGYSVLEVIKAFEKACGHNIPYQIMERRSGDAAISYCDPSRARTELNWIAQRGLDDMCRDAWRWQSQNPEGYA
ncbi:MAG: UDP-glucose 4-epimerase GalE [Anaerolineae bacterium]|nr:UDP-glucose 4-epimerase GalE [Anaerolineae bacterium]